MAGREGGWIKASWRGGCGAYQPRARGSGGQRKSRGCGARGSWREAPLRYLWYMRFAHTQSSSMPALTCAPAPALLFPHTAPALQVFPWQWRFPRHLRPAARHVHLPLNASPAPPPNLPCFPPFPRPPPPLPVVPWRWHHPRHRRPAAQRFHLPPVPLPLRRDRPLLLLQLQRHQRHGLRRPPCMQCALGPRCKTCAHSHLIRECMYDVRLIQWLST